MPVSFLRVIVLDFVCKKILRTSDNELLRKLIICIQNVSLIVRSKPFVVPNYVLNLF